MPEDGNYSSWGHWDVWLRGCKEPELGWWPHCSLPAAGVSGRMRESCTYGIGMWRRTSASIKGFFSILREISPCNPFTLQHLLWAAGNLLALWTGSALSSFSTSADVCCASEQYLIPIWFSFHPPEDTPPTLMFTKFKWAESQTERSCGMKFV